MTWQSWSLTKYALKTPSPGKSGRTSGLGRHMNNFGQNVRLTFFNWVFVSSCWFQHLEIHPLKSLRKASISQNVVFSFPSYHDTSYSIPHCSVAFLCYSQTYGQTHRQTKRQTDDRQTDWKAGRGAGRHTDRQTANRQKHRKTDIKQTQRQRETDCFTMNLRWMTSQHLFIISKSDFDQSQKQPPKQATQICAHSKLKSSFDSTTLRLIWSFHPT